MGRTGIAPRELLKREPRLLRIHRKEPFPLALRKTLEARHQQLVIKFSADWRRGGYIRMIKRTLGFRASIYVVAEAESHSIRLTQECDHATLGVIQISASNPSD